MDIAVLDACPGFKEDVLHAIKTAMSRSRSSKASISNVTQSAMIAAALIRLRRRRTRSRSGVPELQHGDQLT